MHSNHRGTNTSTYSYVFITGGGNGVVGAFHLYPPMLRFFNSHSLNMSDCVVADAPAAMIVADYGGGSFNILRSLLSRGGIGAKFGVQNEARAHMSVNEHNAWVSRDHWPEEQKNQAILDFEAAHPLEGYRRLAKWNRQPSRKGTGFEQPLRAHEPWHVDVLYINV